MAPLALLSLVPARAWRWGAAAALCGAALFFAHQQGVQSERGRCVAARAAEVAAQTEAVDAAAVLTAKREADGIAARRRELNALMALDDIRTGAPCLSADQGDRIRGMLQ